MYVYFFQKMKQHILEYAVRMRSRIPEAKALHAHLVEIFGADAPGYSTLTEHLRKPIWNEREATQPKKRGRPIDESFAQRISDLLSTEPNLSANQVAERLGRPASTVKLYLHNVLHYQFKKTRWVPHFLTDEQLENRRAQSIELLRILQEQEKTDYRFLLTGDESWFFYYSPATGCWVHESEAAPEAERRSHYTEKTMIVIFWNLHGPAVVEAVPNGRSATGEYFRDEIMAKVCELEAFKEAKKKKKQFWIHMDNAPIHRAETVKQYMDSAGLTRTPHPAYSPDLAPSDFYLFGTLKTRIKGVRFRSSDEIKEWIVEQFDEIPSDELRRVFRLWQWRLQGCALLAGHYVE